MEDDPRNQSKVPTSPGRRGPSLSDELVKLLPGQTVLAGDLAPVHPPDLLNFLQQGRRSGILLAITGQIERAVVMNEGAVAWAASNSPGERFGEIVCRLGILPRSTIAAALEEQAKIPGPKRLGEFLSERGLLDIPSRTRALRQQVIDIFLGLLVLRDGRFVFRNGFDASRLPHVLSLDVEGLLLDGLRRIDETEHYRSRIGSAQLVPQLTSVVVPALDGDAFTPEMRRLMELIDGHKTLLFLSEIAGLGEFEATKAAFHLLGTGHISLLDRGQPTAQTEAASSASAASSTAVTKPISLPGTPAVTKPISLPPPPPPDAHDK